MTEPAEVFPLAEYLCDEIQARGWTTIDVALRMGGATEHEIAKDLLAVDVLLCVQNDKLEVGDRLFTALAKVFDVSEEFLRNLDAMWRRWPAKRAEFTPPESIFGPISRRATIRVGERTGWTWREN